jgi:hypothetical protein
MASIDLRINVKCSVPRQVIISRIRLFKLPPVIPDCHADRKEYWSNSSLRSLQCIIYEGTGHEIDPSFKIWAFPLPNLISFLGWTYIFLTSGWAFISFGVLTLLMGVAAVAAFFVSGAGGRARSGIRAAGRMQVVVLPHESHESIDTHVGSLYTSANLQSDRSLVPPLREIPLGLP